MSTTIPLSEGADGSWVQPFPRDRRSYVPQSPGGTAPNFSHTHPTTATIANGEDTKPVPLKQLEIPHTPQPPQAHTTASPSFTNGTATPVATTSIRRGWLSNISSKFSSHAHSEAQQPASPTAESPQKTNPGFLIATLRKLSVSGAQARAFSARNPPNGGQCQRVVMNRNLTRDRCRITELDGVKLKKVAFCVDVEVSVAPPIKDEADAPTKKRKELKETKEGEDNTEAVSKLVPKEDHDTPKADSTALDGTHNAKDEPASSNSNPQPDIPLEKPVPNDYGTSPPPDSVNPMPNGGSSSEKSEPAKPESTEHKPRRRPTTDVARIYKRCCQLREMPPLPIIAEQLTASAGKTSLDFLDISNHPLHLSDALVLSDFLALAPVTKLDLENCGLTDESLRVILSGLLAVKQPSDRHKSATTSCNTSKENLRRSGSSASHKPSFVKPRGMIEWLSLRNNPKIGRDGWRYISCFLHMSRSLKALDVSMIPLPRNPAIHSPGRAKPQASPTDCTALFCKALSERLAGVGLQELALNRCELSTEQLRWIVEAVRQGQTKRLDLEGNHITDDGLIYLAQWIKDGSCEGISLSSNDLQDHIDILAASLHEGSPLQALCLANCNLNAGSLSSLLPALTVLKNFRLLDLSHNPTLFSTQPDALPLLRRYLPKLPMLKKLQLAHTYMTPDHAIALSEILPEIKNLAHFNVLDNPLLVPGAATFTDFGQSTPDGINREGSQEEGAALYTALAAAVKVSKSIVRMDIDDPGADAGEVIKGLARKVVAFCLRNLEAAEVCQNKPLPAPPDDGELHTETDDEDTYDGVEEKDNLVVGGTGVVKALGVCLGNKPHLNRSPSSPGPCNPLDLMSRDIDYTIHEKANEMSKLLLLRARKIKARIQPALERAAREVDEIQHRKLLFLDDTLYRVITRFEEEYPECRTTTKNAVSIKLKSSTILAPSVVADTPSSSHESSSNGPSLLDVDDDQNDDSRIKTPSLSRQSSDISLHSRALDHEEGRIHKLATFVKKEIFEKQTSPKSCGTVALKDGLEGGVETRPEIIKIRDFVDGLAGDEIRQKIVAQGGAEGLIKRLEGVLNKEKDSIVALDKVEAGRTTAIGSQGDIPDSSPLSPLPSPALPLSPTSHEQSA